jgi:hypothetical protein
MRNYSIYSLISFLFLANSCNSIDSPDPVASYVFIPSLEMVNQPGYGSLKQNFTEAWIYLDGNLLGAFPIPGLVPLIKSGQGELQIFAGIHNNGIKETAELYPLVERAKINKLFTPGKIDTIYPKFAYRDDVTPLLIEDFEGSISLFSEKLKGKGVKFITDDVFEGTKSCALELDTLQPLNEISSIELNNLPKDGTRIYVEINYKNEVDFLVGLKGYSANDQATQYIVGVRPSDTWKKIYIELTNEVLSSDFPNYKLLIQTGLPFDGVKITKDNARILLDNIKLMY